MRLRYIELIHAVLTAGSVTGAARLLNISEPAASKALQHAEDQLGFALFSRVRGRLLPTEPARLLSDPVKKIIQNVHELQRLTANVGSPKNCPLRVTCTPTLALILLPRVIIKLREAFPDATIELSTLHSAMICESLTLRDTDIGLTLQDTGHYVLQQQALCCGQIMVIAPPGWWTAGELTQPMPIGALANQPMISITVHDAMGSQLHNYLAGLASSPKAHISVQTYQLAYSLVAAGEGLALVDPFTAHSHFGTTKGVQIRPLKPQIGVTLYAMWRSDSSLTKVQKRFVDLVRRYAQQIVAQS